MADAGEKRMESRDAITDPNQDVGKDTCRSGQTTERESKRATIKRMRMTEVAKDDAQEREGEREREI